MRENWGNLKLEESLKGGALSPMLGKADSAGHQSAIQIGDTLGLDRKRGVGSDFGVGVPLLLGGGHKIF
jgi:hypothetical protein